jgi:phosphoribosylformylglycinamidine (FGAM) synthase-like enzyme/phosphoribosylformylglycinamidine (FGAM) synthase PurS component
MPQTAPANSPRPPVHRFEVRPKLGHADPIGAAVTRDARSVGVALEHAQAARVYLVQADLSPADAAGVRDRVLADPVTETAASGAAPPAQGDRIVEIHPLPGVMDPVAQTVAAAIRELTGRDADVSTGWRYDLRAPAITGEALSAADAAALASRLLANPVIQRIHTEPYHPRDFPRSTPHEHLARSIPILNLSDDELTRLSRDAHLFLSLDEMKAVQAHYRAHDRDPFDIELETIAQTWSEHCVHKTLKSTVTYRGDLDNDPIDWTGRPGHTVNPDGSVTINNLLKSTVAAATFALIKDGPGGGIDWTLSVFVDNAGVIAFDDDHAVCIKVETHNHPSAIEPYGGAATGIGGCIRDVIATGLGARPIANTDVFCVAMPTGWGEARSSEVTKSRSGKVDEDAVATTPPLRHSANLPLNPLPPGTLHPRRILTQVVAGVRDYGNRMGIPTVNGAVYFDDRYVGNPLVYCGCIGVMPRDKVHGRVTPGDLIVALGGRTGRDGIHGATFSSAELEQTAADEFSHAVQIGNAIEEKRTLDAILRARDEGPRGDGAHLYSALTDCGAGGFSSAVGEMGKSTGAIVHLDRAPLKYPGLSYTEIWISEAQERMVLAVRPANLAALERICREESVELAVLGEFRPAPGSAPDRPALQLLYHNREVGRLDMHFLHEGIPTPTREATWGPAVGAGGGSRRLDPAPPSGAADASDSTGPNRLLPQAAPSPAQSDLAPTLLALLAHPNIASKHWIIRQYDHEVRGNTVLKPLVGPAGRGPGDASVIQPVPGTRRGLAVACGLQTGIGDPEVGGDPYLMVLAAVDECVRNLVCTGADPDRIAILDNFCWPSCAKPANLGSLVRAAEGCYDAAIAYRTPFVSGKDSLNNQLKYTDPATGNERVIEIPPTLLITGIGIVPDVSRCVTMDAKRPGNLLVLVGTTQPNLGGSHALRVDPALPAHRAVPTTDLLAGPRTARAVAALIADALVASAHDVSDGGLLAAAAEMLIAADPITDVHAIGATLNLSAAHADPVAAAFSESPSRYLLEIAEADADTALARLRATGTPFAIVGVLDDTGLLRAPGAMTDTPVSRLTELWTSPLDW